MVSSEARQAIHEIQKQRELYSVEELQKVLFSLGYEVPRNTLYLAMKWTGWLKLRLVRERLLEVKREIPKRYPFDGLRQLVKWPLLADREEDLG